jgi:hypothetical protein
MGRGYNGRWNTGSVERSEYTEITVYFTASELLQLPIKRKSNCSQHLSLDETAAMDMSSALSESTITRDSILQEAGFKYKGFLRYVRIRTYH